MTVSTIEFSPDAAQQIRTIATWWRHNRLAAPELFSDELQAALEMLRAAPFAGAAYPRPAIPNLRRLLLQRTGYHVYFAFHEDRRLVFVHAIWHAKRGRGPRL